MLQLTNHIHNYYLLSFQPKSGPDGNPSPGMHSIRVSVPDYPSARLRFRESYFSGALDTVPPEAQWPRKAKRPAKETGLQQSHRMQNPLAARFWSRHEE
jgi:hypothetical protein